MTNKSQSAAPKVVIVGAGFGGLAAAKALGDRNVEVTVVDRLNYHLFQPLLYQVALAGLAATDVAYPIRGILRREQNVDVLLGEVVDLDLQARRVRLSDGYELGYDYLVVAAGARTSYFGHDGWARFAPGLKDLDDALEIRRRVLLALEKAERTQDAREKRRLLTFIVVGGGPTGVELAGAIADLSRDILRGDFRRVRPEETRVVLIEAADRILLPFEPPLAARAEKQLRDLGVDVRVGVRVERIDEQGVWIGTINAGPSKGPAPPAMSSAGRSPASRDAIPAATVLWAAGVRPNPLTAKLGVPLDRAGRVIVEQDCSVPGHPEAFVIGDMARFVSAGETEPLPGISPVAIQQGRAVADNLLRARQGLPRRPFAYHDKGFMATIGRARAVAKLGKLRLWGLLAWLAWVVVHLWYLVGFRNRLAVFLNWIWAYAISSHGARVITSGKAGSDGAVPEKLPRGVDGDIRAGQN
jgi:NADH:ubiquinone reductase (H+-translocating)